MEGTLLRWGLLEGLHPMSRAHLLAATAEREFRRGDRLFDEGDSSSVAHFIESGRVAVQTAVPTGATVAVEMRGAGDVVGVVSAFGDARRVCAVVAVEATRTRALSRPAFETLRKTRGVEAALAHLIADDPARLGGLPPDLQAAPTARRVLNRLLEISPATQPPVSVPVHQADLAVLAGTSRESVNRVLRAAEASGLLSIHRDHIILLDPAAIEAGL